MKALKKEITFIYMDAAERAMYEALADEAKARGYEVKFTDNKLEKCEIGVYCQHVNFPQFSKFSVIMLHDIIQQYSNWPDLWFREPWNKYDVGILPSDQWVENWNQCSHIYYARPRMGMYKVGWPKADKFANIKDEEKRNAFYEKHGLDKSKRTVLYAPSWENDRKQDDFVQSMLKLDVNILIKQSALAEGMFPEMARCVKEMYELHKDIPEVTILDPKTNIFEAIAASDILVSEESSTMCEATMMGIPAISVSNWLVPDTTPSRYPECNYSFVTMTTKEDLTECVSDVLTNYDTYKHRAEEYSRLNFSNIGKSSKMIMDIIDDYVEGRPQKYKELVANPLKNIPVKQKVKHWLIGFKNEVYYNYRVRFKLVEGVYNVLRSIKKKVFK